ncbi:MAG: hypothetical protein WD065_08085 [Planctomycetaceae bacterium]
MKMFSLVCRWLQPVCLLVFYQLHGPVAVIRQSSMTKHLFIGGLVAAGFDASGAYLLTVSHSGRGVFETTTWERVARDIHLAYPENGRAIGIGPIDGVSIPVSAILNNQRVEKRAVDASSGSRDFS